MYVCLCFGLTDAWPADTDYIAHGLTHDLAAHDCAHELAFGNSHHPTHRGKDMSRGSP